jgi:hypothetical protein
MTVSKAETRRGPVLVVLLVIVSVVNLLALAIGVEAWYDEAAHGGDLQGLRAIGTLLAAIGLAGIAGAWARREWGATLYLGAQCTGFALTLFTMPETIGLLSFVPLLLAGLLWLLTR